MVAENNSSSGLFRLMDQQRLLCLGDSDVILSVCSDVADSGRPYRIIDLYFRSLAPQHVVQNALDRVNNMSFRSPSDMTYQKMSGVAPNVSRYLIEQVPLIPWIRIDSSNGAVRGGIDVMILACEDDCPLGSFGASDLPYFTVALFERMRLKWHKSGSYASSKYRIVPAVFKIDEDVRLEVIPYHRMPDLQERIRKHVARDFAQYGHHQSF
jgi:hypothetical protein